MGLCSSCINDGEKKLSLFEIKVVDKLESAIETETGRLYNTIIKFKECKNSNVLGCNINNVADAINIKYHLEKYNVLKNRLKKIRQKHCNIKFSKLNYSSSYQEYFGNYFEFKAQIKSLNMDIMQKLENVSKECDKILTEKKYITYSEFDRMNNILSASDKLSNDELLCKILK